MNASAVTDAQEPEPAKEGHAQAKPAEACAVVAQVSLTTLSSFAPTATQKIVVDGEHWAESLWKVGMVIPCVFLGVWLWGIESPYFAGTDAAVTLKGVAVILFLIAACLPGNSHTCLDLLLRKVVTQNHYAGFKVWEHCRPLDDYDSIVVRHRCHSTEVGESYTGDVGLKPAKKGPVLWVKSFPAEPDEIPTAAFHFARELQDATSLALQIPNQTLPNSTVAVE